MRNIFLETEKATSIETFHTYMKDIFGFPYYYGRNLDALYDCLTGISEYILITMPADFDGLLDGYGKRVYRVFEDAARYNKHLYLCVALENNTED